MKILFAAFLISMGSLLSCFSAESLKTPQTKVTLISEKEGVAPGVDTLFAVHFELEPGWHIYWKNPGDSGLPPRAEWLNPNDLGTFGPLQFPVPEMIPYKTQMNFGYEKSAFFPIQFSPRDDLQPGKEIKAFLRLKWLICKEECLPGKIDLDLMLPVVSKEDFQALSGTNSPLFANAKKNLPKKLGINIELKSFQKSDVSGGLDVFFPGIRLEKKGFHFFPEEDIGINLFETVVPEVTEKGSTLHLNQRNFKPVSSLHGLVKYGGKEFYEFSSDANSKIVVNETPPQSLILMLFFAFIGGMILNLMPCILPVLSIKVMGLIHQSGENQKSIRKQGLSFTLGVLVSFWLLAGVILLVRSSGSTLGWGFQLQNPIFVSVLSILFYLMGLNLLGFFEFGGSWMGIGQSLAVKEGYVGSFFTGVLTTVAATPCSAPFMGTALGFALTQTAWIAVLVLTMLGLGLSSPYLLFSYVPKASRFLPKPGKWMLNFKEFLAFPLFGTTVWLLSVLMQQAGNEASTITLRLGLSLTFLIWIFSRNGKWKWILTVIIISLLGRDVSHLVQLKVDQTHSSDRVSELSPPWKLWSRLNLERALSSKKTVFVNVTADWCVTCKVNETLVFSRDTVSAALSGSDVVAYKADWTSGDPDLTKYLEENGRNSVPVYLVYRKGNMKPEILPQVISTTSILKALSSK